jgi:putative ABC transport system permease protein
MFVYGYVEHGKETFSSFVIASESNVTEIWPKKNVEGIFFLPTEQELPVCVLTNAPKTEIYGDKPAVGQSITVRGVDFRIVGVQEPEKDDSFLSFGSFSNVVYVPYSAARKLYKGGQINRILFKADLKLDPERILASVKRKLQENHGGKEDFGTLTAKQILATIYRVFNIVTALLAGISAISLIVAGIGIMNIMLVTVTERTREIGIRKTVGARRHDIFVQFLTEAVIMSFTGGVIGTVLAMITCAVVAAHSPLKPLITVWAVLEAFGVCFLVGLVFGVAPAVRAARQNPIDALRWE